MTTQPDPYDPDRGSGMFTSGDRKLLTGEQDFSDRKNPANALRQARYRLRERFRNTLLDFILLAEGMGSDEIDIALRDMFEDVELAESFRDVPILRGMHEAMYAFAYSTDPVLFEEMVLSATQEGVNQRQFADSVWSDAIFYPFLYTTHSPLMKLSHLKQLRERGLLRHFCESVVDNRPPTPTIDTEHSEQVAEMVAHIEERLDAEAER